MFSKHFLHNFNSLKFFEVVYDPGMLILVNDLCTLGKKKYFLLLLDGMFY